MGNKARLSGLFGPRQMHRIYLLLAVFIGVGLSLFMPLFNEPDGQYHYTYSTNIAGLSNDISKYGEAVTSGLKNQIPTYQLGNHFETYYEMPITRVPINDLPRGDSVPPATSFNYWGHVLPAIGVWLGYHIYPSIGVMITIGRLFVMLTCNLLMFFIIKTLRRGKLFFMALSLSPVITNTFSSLSYDSISYVLVAATAALVINVVDREKVTPRDFLQMLVLTILLIFAAKTNFIFLVLLFPLVYIGVRWKKQKIFQEGGLVLWGSLLLLLALGVVMVEAGGLTFAQRLFFNFAINTNSNSLNLFANDSNLFLAVFAAPYPSFNYVPLWVGALWYILLVAILLFHDRFVNSAFISFGALGIFVFISIGIFYGFVNYTIAGAKMTNALALGQFLGMQGRYFTPLFLIFPLFAGYHKFQLKAVKHVPLLAVTVIIILLSNALLLYGTLFGVYYM